MSFFKSKAIILKIYKNKDKNFIYDIFTYEFGKIKIQKKDAKKEKALDIWYIINFEIETKEWREINNAKNIKIKSEFIYENMEFITIMEYLNIIWLIHKKLALWIEFREIFEIVEEINIKNNLDETKLILAKLKIINLIWELKIENANKTVEKILKYINSNKITEILRLSGIDDTIKSILKNIN